MDDNRLFELAQRAERATKVAKDIRTLAGTSYENRDDLMRDIYEPVFEAGKAEVLAKLENELEGLLNPPHSKVHALVVRDVTVAGQ